MRRYAYWLTAPGYMVGTWTFTDPDVPLDTRCYELRLDGTVTVRQISASAVAVYYGAVEPGGRSILLLHNDIHRSAMSRHRFATDGSLAEEGRWSSGGQGGSYIAFDPSGRHFVVATAYTGWVVFRNGTEPELIATMRSGRVIGPEDIAALAVHLMENEVVTGATYDIDGG